ncbi:MAG TPA: hypothetical protein PKI93_07740 [Alphaproteobacteria bacterium]|nr:hypothetical protein [Alphaproteobacteria bacterium]HNS44770.1 hypothetical protein [Alphaproteobacteria bacterium]
MSAESLYEHLSYLDEAIGSLESILADKDAEIADLNLRLANAEMTIVAARKESEDFANRINRDAQKYIENEVHARVSATLAAERQAMKDELDKARAQVAAANAKSPKKKDDPQTDLFGQTWGAPAAPQKVANDQSALILAGKLDSTIDKVQRLLREAGA